MRLLLGGLPLQMPARDREDAVDLLGRGRKRDDEADEALVVADSLFLRQAQVGPGVIGGAGGAQRLVERLRKDREDLVRLGRPGKPYAGERREPFRQAGRDAFAWRAFSSQWPSSK